MVGNNGQDFTLFQLYYSVWRRTRIDSWLDWVHCQLLQTDFQQVKKKASLLASRLALIGYFVLN